MFETKPGNFKFYVRTGGLMEDPVFKWTYWGYGEGDNLEDACNKKFADDPDYRSETKTTWGWDIGYEDEHGCIKFVRSR